MVKGEYSKGRFICVSVLLLLLFLILIMVNISGGSVEVSWSDIVRVLFSGRSGDDDMSYDIILSIRLPRMLAGIILGGALALSGFLLQTFFNNPIAGPYVLGISSGAKLAVAVTMVTMMGRHQVTSSLTLIGAAFVGAMLSMLFVLAIARVVAKSSMLIVSGIMIGYICSAVTDFIITFADDASIVNLHNWSNGSFSGTTWTDVRIMCIVVLAASLATFFMSKPIGAYQLGENYAQNMGVNIKLFRVVLVLLSSLLCAAVTAFAGPISFVGIAVPHLIKSMLKTAKPLAVIPLCFLGGAIFCLGCDLIARTAFSPLELNISSVTAIFGAPIVIWIMVRKKVRD